MYNINVTCLYSFPPLPVHYCVSSTFYGHIIPVQHTSRKPQLIQYSISAPVSQRQKPCTFTALSDESDFEFGINSLQNFPCSALSGAALITAQYCFNKKPYCKIPQGAATTPSP